MKQTAKGLFVWLQAAFMVLPALSPQASAAGNQSYVLTKVMEDTEGGSAYAEKVAGHKAYYEADMARGMTIDYEFRIGDWEHHWHHIHRYDGQIYEPHKTITEDVK